MTDKDLHKYKKAFGDNLKRIRIEKYSSLSKLDVDTKFDSSNYHKYEKGEGNPTLKTILELANNLEIHPRDLLDFEFEVTGNE